MALVYETEGHVWTFGYCRQKYGLGRETSDSVESVSSLAVYNLMIRSGLFERVYKSPKDLVCSLHRVRGSAIVVLSVFVYKVIYRNCRTHAVLHRTDAPMSVAYVCWFFGIECNCAWLSLTFLLLRVANCIHLCSYHLYGLEPQTLEVFSKGAPQKAQWFI